MIDSLRTSPPGQHLTSADVAEHVRSSLEVAGLRYTAQRQAVFAALAELKSHPTAEELYQEVRRSLPRISLATVYKALEALVAAGLATKLTSGDASARYDCQGVDHYHLRDTRTGHVHDLPTTYDPHLLEKLDPHLVRDLSQCGFQVTGYRLEVLGTFAPRASAGQTKRRSGSKARSPAPQPTPRTRSKAR